MSWGMFPGERKGLSSLLDHLLESSSFDPLESSSLDPLWSLLCSTLYWMESSLDPLGSPLLHPLLDGVFT